MEKHKKLVRVVCLVLAALMVMTIGVPLIFSAMFLCAVINLAVNHQLSWALYPIGASAQGAGGHQIQHQRRGEQQGKIRADQAVLSGTGQ